jgi:hypothetical protein
MAFLSFQVNAGIVLQHRPPSLPTTTFRTAWVRKMNKSLHCVHNGHRGWAGAASVQMGRLPHVLLRAGHVFQLYGLTQATELRRPFESPSSNVRCLRVAPNSYKSEPWNNMAGRKCRACCIWGYCSGIVFWDVTPCSLMFRCSAWFLLYDGYMLCLRAGIAQSV